MYLVIIYTYTVYNFILIHSLTHSLTLSIHIHTYTLYSHTLYRRVAGAVRPHRVPGAQGEQALVHRTQRLLQQRPVTGV